MSQITSEMPHIERGDTHMCRITITKTRRLQVVRLEGAADTLTRRIAKAINRELSRDTEALKARAK
jgi:hypothetical protein